MTNANDFIYPSTHQNEDGTHNFNINKGLTKREYFAAMAMQGMLANNAEGNIDWDYDIVGKHCLKAADALIKALNEQ